MACDAGPATFAALLAELRAALAAPDAGTAALGAKAQARLLAAPAGEAVATRIECLLVLAQIHHIAARVREARLPTEAAVALAQGLGDAPTLRRALTFRGVIEMESGNLPAATEVLSQALQVAQTLPDASQASPVWNNLGLALQRWSLNSEALQCYQRALELSEGSASFAVVHRSALSNIASCALHDDDLRAGLQAARQAIAINPAPVDATARLSRGIAEGNLARLLLRVGELQAAEAHAAQAVQWTADLGSGRGELVAALTPGMVAVHQGRHDEGLPLLKRALEIARQRVPAEVRDTLAACIEGYRHAGQHDVALVYLHELLAMNRHARAEQVLAQHHEHLARLDSAPLRQPRAGDAAVTHEQALLRDGLQQRELIRNRMRLLEQQSVAAELHDDTTGEHCYRVGRLAAILAREIGLEDHVCFLIDLAARLHDIGKLVVPDAILLKPGRLTEGEFALMQTHTTAGADILARSGVPQMHIAEEIARHHHERWNGCGYPMGLARERIPIAARVTALADVFDALTHARPYKTAWPVADALAEIRRLRGEQFDPELTDVFLALVPRLQRELGDLDAHLAAEAQHSPFVSARRQIAAALKGDDPARSLFDARR
jgi:putative two-component system response regulator